jgi:hypothetical protein
MRSCSPDWTAALERFARPRLDLLATEPLEDLGERARLGQEGLEDRVGRSERDLAASGADVAQPEDDLVERASAAR